MRLIGQVAHFGYSQYAANFKLFSPKLLVPFCHSELSYVPIPVKIAKLYVVVSNGRKDAEGSGNMEFHPWGVGNTRVLLTIMNLIRPISLTFGDPIVVDGPMKRILFQFCNDDFRLVGDVAKVPGHGADCYKIG